MNAYIRSRYAAPCHEITVQELEPLLDAGYGRLLSVFGSYPLLRRDGDLWSLIGPCSTLLSFAPQDVLAVYGKSIDIWRADEGEGEGGVYYLQDSLCFLRPVLDLLESFEEPLL